MELCAQRHDSALVLSNTNTAQSQCDMSGRPPGAMGPSGGPAGPKLLLPLGAGPPCTPPANKDAAGTPPSPWEPVAALAVPELAACSDWVVVAEVLLLGCDGAAGEPRGGSSVAWEEVEAEEEPAPWRCGARVAAVSISRVTSSDTCGPITPTTRVKYLTAMCMHRTLPLRTIQALAAAQVSSSYAKALLTLQ